MLFTNDMLRFLEDCQAELVEVGLARESAFDRLSLTAQNFDCERIKIHVISPAVLRDGSRIMKKDRLQQAQADSIVLMSHWYK